MTNTRQTKAVFNTAFTLFEEIADQNSNSEIESYGVGPNVKSSLETRDRRRRIDERGRGVGKSRTCVDDLKLESTVESRAARRSRGQNTT